MHPQATVIVLCGIGVAAGLLSGMFGLGGGLIMVPALIVFAGFSQMAANGTNLAVLMIPVGFAAVAEYYRHGNVDTRAALIIAVSFVLAAWLSAHIAQKINPHYMRIAFGIFIMISGGYLTVTSILKLR